VKTFHIVKCKLRLSDIPGKQVGAVLVRRDVATTQSVQYSTSHLIGPLQNPQRRRVNLNKAN